MNPVISQFRRLAMLSEKERFIVADNSNPLVVNCNFALFCPSDRKRSILILDKELFKNGS